MQNSKPRRARPRNLNLTTIRLPLPALVSILHRISGVLLFLALPMLLLALQYSLASLEDYNAVSNISNHPLFKLLLLVLIWAFLHHLLAGLRHLAMDVHWGVGLENARLSSKIVLVLSLALTLLAGVALC
jgi:succinate dehydrogenase / fumarate reductase, cytochrome b subunit